MKKLLHLLGLIMLSLVIGWGLCSCEERAPDMTKKEMDVRLLGTWTILEPNDTEVHPKEKTITFHPDGSCIGFHYPGGKRFFYTEDNSRLFIFVYGSGLKLSNWTYERFYKIVGDKLFIWGAKEDMIADKYETAMIYSKMLK